MVVNIGYKKFPEFNVRNDPKTVYARFSKCAKRFKDNHLKVYNITDKHQQRSLFDRRSHARYIRTAWRYGNGFGRSYHRTTEQVQRIAKPAVQYTQISLHYTGKDETWDSFITRLKAEGEHYDFPAGWLDTEILMAMITNGKSKRVGRKLLQDQLTLAEALKYARGLESATLQD